MTEECLVDRRRYQLQQQVKEQEQEQDQEGDHQDGRRGMRMDNVTDHYHLPLLLLLLLPPQALPCGIVSNSNLLIILQQTADKGNFNLTEIGQQVVEEDHNINVRMAGNINIMREVHQEEVVVPDVHLPFPLL